MGEQNLKIDHIGIVVRSLDIAIEHWKEVFGYYQFTKIVTNTRQKVNVVFMKKKDSMMIKLVEATDEKSPVYKFARKGGGLHHLCFKCDDIHSGIRKLQSEGLRMIAEPQPGEAFDNEVISFIYGKGLNIELIDTNKKAEILPQLIED